MRRFSHGNSKLTPRGHLLRARFKRIRKFYLENKKMPPKTDDYFLPEDFIEAFGHKCKHSSYIPKTIENGYLPDPVVEAA